MLKKFLFAFFFVIFFLLSFDKVFAKDFLTNADVSYEVLPSGEAKVTYKIRVQNTKSERLANSFVLHLSNMHPKEVKAYTTNKTLSVEEKSVGVTNSQLIITLEKVAGLGKYQEFFISFIDPTVTMIRGEVLEINIPKLYNANEFDEYKLNLIVPTNFGKLSFMTPEPSNREDFEEKTIYYFSKESVQNDGVSAGFGQFQVYEFSIKYHLENSDSNPKTLSAPLPPDTSTQKVFLTEISTKPKNVLADSDGNWIAEFVLNGNEKKDVLVKGSVQLFTEPEEFRNEDEKYLKEVLKENVFWESDNEYIKNLAKTLKTPREIYDYVTEVLKYSPESFITDSRPRKGALKALKEPNDAVCLEFTDAFIAISRAAGIPAREMEGFAYIENAEDPLSRFSDILHSWPEYYSETKKAWVPIDPTWGSITRNDYFSNTDLKHVAFVIHGLDSQKPYPPGSFTTSTKDIEVKLGNIPEKRDRRFEVSAKDTGNLSIFSKKINIRIENKSSFAVYNLEPEIYYDNKLMESVVVKVLPPFASHEFNKNIQAGFLSTKMPKEVTITTDQFSYILLTGKETSALIQLFLFSLFLIIILILSHARFTGKVIIWGQLNNAAKFIKTTKTSILKKRSR